MSNWPLLQFVQDLGDFDLVALLLGAVIAFFSAGFAIDYIVGRYGMGPYWNGIYAMLGAYAGLCARNSWLQPYVAYDPYLTTVAIACGLLPTVVMVSAVAKREPGQGKPFFGANRTQNLFDPADLYPPAALRFRAKLWRTMPFL